MGNYLGSGGFNPQDYMMRKLMDELFGGGKDKLTISGVEKLLDSYISTEDITTSAGIEKVYGKIDTSLKTGTFGNDIAINDFVKNYMSTLTQAGVSRTQTLSDRKNLYTLTNPSNIKKLITEAQVMKDTTKSIDSIENKIVDLSTSRDKLADKKLLSTALDTRFNNAISMLDNSLREFGTDGLSKKEIARIMKGTYATMVLADAGIEAKEKELIMTAEFKKPEFREKQYLKILNDIETSVNEYDDKLNFLRQEYSFMETVIPSSGGPNPERDKMGDDLAMSSAFRQQRIINKYSGQYKTAYDNLKALRKKHPKKMIFLDYDEIMNKKVHNELYNYVPFDPNNNNNTNNNKGFQPQLLNKKEELNTVNNMLRNRTITFTKDIFMDNRDKYNVMSGDPKIWKQKGESVSGLGNPGVNTWKLKKDGIKRDSDGNLISLELEIPSGYMPFNLRPEVYMRGSISLTPEDFVIEDSPNYSGIGYKIFPQGKASYNIHNNLYELIQK
jgi:hypothetical protein